jgi:hypothetical protein
MSVHFYTGTGSIKKIHSLRVSLAPTPQNILEQNILEYIDCEKVLYFLC